MFFIHYGIHVYMCMRVHLHVHCVWCFNLQGQVSQVTGYLTARSDSEESFLLVKLLILCVTLWYISMYIHVHMYMCIHNVMYTCICSYEMFMYMHVDMKIQCIFCTSYIYTYMYMYMYKYVHVHIHVHIQYMHVIH